MRKTYPYLQNVYSPDLNDEQKKRYFLSYIDNFVNQRQYVHLILLDWQENPIRAIEGEISSGSISKDGSSSVRRTCNLSCSVDGNSYNVDDMNMDFTLNKKIFIEIGVKNDSPYYQEYPILWFPQGVFFITSFSMNSSSSSVVNLSLGLKDKMALLNGDIGGTFPTSIRLDTMDTQVSTGESVEQKVLIYDLIVELVNHWGGEDLNNIVIEDVPLRIRKIMRWGNTQSPLYAVEGEVNSDNKTFKDYTFSLIAPSKKEEESSYKFEYGDDVGYVYADFVINKELTLAAGENVCSALDQIKNILGNYEYFYDEMGIFHFREIKNFMNVTQAEFLLDEMSENDYLIETTNEKSVYAFDDNINMTSISVSPQYENIKNDYIVHGLKKGDSDSESVAVMYHLVIDKKPDIIGYRNNKPYYGIFNYVICYTDSTDKLNKLAIISAWKDEKDNGKIKSDYRTMDSLPAVGNNNVFYYTWEENKIYYWKNNQYLELTYAEIQKTDNGEIKTQEVNGIEEPVIEQKSLFFNGDCKYAWENYYVKDWRTFLYLKGLAAQALGTDEEEYFQELAAFWPREYCLEHNIQEWAPIVNKAKNKYSSLSSVCDVKYYLDFIDTDSSLNQFSVSSIGHRKDVIHSDDINCIFEPEIPDVIFLNIDNPSVNVSENTQLQILDNEDKIISKPTAADILASARKYCINNGHTYTQVHEDIYSNLILGGYSNSAYEKIKYELFLHSNYQKVISITALPVFYLEPNTRVSINDASTNTYGNFMIKTISLTLGPGANMSVSLSEIHERL